MNFQTFLDDMKQTAHCPHCKKPYELIEHHIDELTGDLTVKIECHGEKYEELITKGDVEELERRRELNLKQIDIPKNIQPKKRTVLITPEHYSKFSKFKRLK